MNEELDKKLVKAFPLLYGDRSAPMQSTAMCWGFSCGDGWFDLIWDLSSKLEPLIQKFIDDNPLAPCGGCGCKKERHYGWKSWKPGKCLAIHVDPESKEEPPNNYFACFCDEYRSPHPRASQIKEKFGGLRCYMTCGTDEIFDLIDKAEALSCKTCEECGESGEARSGGWIHTLCDTCHKNWDEIRAKRWEMNKETKGSHPTTGGDSLLRELKKEIIKLKSLNRRAAEEIRDLDDMIIKSIEDNKVIEYPEEDKAYFAGFSSINLLNRLDGITNGGYIENYEDLLSEMKAI